ncbi:MAG: hypothetical protein M2R45_02662 [Verrucomicrobia subdivision 3 bacterium]|nr:hypothetical protein [Limisphaerales bacterium]MCS1414039.1 hypothetical protein [Limisphaerales bacterium]
MTLSQFRLLDGTLFSAIQKEEGIVARFGQSMGYVGSMRLISGTLRGRHKVSAVAPPGRARRAIRRGDAGKLRARILWGRGACRDRQRRGKVERLLEQNPVGKGIVKPGKPTGSGFRENTAAPVHEQAIALLDRPPRQPLGLVPWHFKSPGQS